MNRGDQRRYWVALALCRGATALVYETDLAPPEVDELAGLFGWLVRQGHLACSSIQPVSPALGRQGMLEALRGVFGDLVVNADLAAGAPPSEPAPAFLAPVWPFDHEVGGRPASTAIFLGLDMELVASPSGDEEVGFRLPDRDGLWVVHARPLCSGDFVRQGPATPQ